MNNQWKISDVAKSVLMLSVAAFPAISVSDNLVENGSFEVPAEAQGDYPGGSNMAVAFLKRGICLAALLMGR